MSNIYLNLTRAESGPASGKIVVQSIMQEDEMLYEYNEEDPMIVGENTYHCDIEFFLQTEGGTPAHKHKAKLYQGESSFIIKPGGKK